MGRFARKPISRAQRPLLLGERALHTSLHSISSQPHGLLIPPLARFSLLATALLVLDLMSMFKTIYLLYLRFSTQKLVF